MASVPRYFGGAKRIHLVGIKGVGMTALAQVLKEQGFTISGSDTGEVFVTDSILRNLHIRVAEGFNPLNIPPKAEVIIHSAAYSPENNIELQEASKMNMPLITYPQALGLISVHKFGIGIAGTHGKTTSTAMTAKIMYAIGLDPTVICGSAMKDFDGLNARVGTSDLFVAETCEYRRHFLHFAPQCLLFTNVEAEHLDYFKDIADVRSAFVEYARRLPDNGILILNNDDSELRQVASALADKPVQVVTFGLASGDWQAANISFAEGMTSFDVGYQGTFMSRIELPIPGTHNVMNALGSIALTVTLLRNMQAPEPWLAIADALKSFGGTTRRFEKKGVINGISIFDDYAHHPTEIRATLAGARAQYPNSSIWVAFMAHTYSRTKELLDDFATAFADASHVIINDIYGSARETAATDINGKILADRIKIHTPDTRYIASFDETAAVIRKQAKPGDLFITMGAGNNWRIGELLVNNAVSSKGTTKLSLDRF